MSKPFDSYLVDYKIVIVTKEYSGMHDDIVDVEHYISIERAKDIISQLQEAVRLAETRPN